MSLMPDYHMHTPLCRHAAGEPIEYAARAVELGLVEIGFSDHSPMPRDDFDDWRMRYSQLSEYVEKVEAARRAFPQLTIRLALEVDYLPGGEEWIRHLASLHPWDYLIGSVHYVSDTWDVDSPFKLSEWKKRDPFEVWSLYFERLTSAAASGCCWCGARRLDRVSVPDQRRPGAGPLVGKGSVRVPGPRRPG